MLNVYAIGDWGESSALVMGWAAQQQPHRSPGHNIRTQITGSGWCWHISPSLIPDSRLPLTSSVTIETSWCTNDIPKGRTKKCERHWLWTLIIFTGHKTVFRKKNFNFWSFISEWIIGFKTSNPTTWNVNGITTLSNEHKAISSCNKRLSLLLSRTLKGVS